ncbi:MAG: peptidoglycan-binding domain-containing protein [Hyphomicrobiaceae bacterium]
MGKLIGLILVAAGFGFALEMAPTGFFGTGMALFDRPLERLAAASPAVTTVAAPARRAPAVADRTEAPPRVFAASRPLIAATETTARNPVIAPAPVIAARPPSDPAELARLLQSELRRVGCYAGDIDGDWGPGSKRAMQAFTERVNSTLPVDAPDLVLLSLVRGHNRQICASECGAGDILSSRGHCVRAPSTVQAQSGAAQGWRPVVAVQSSALPAPSVASGNAQPTPAPRRVASAPQLAPLVSGTKTVRPAVSPAPGRQIDWSTRMSIGASPTTPVPAASPVEPAALTPAPPATTPTAVAPRPTVAQREPRRRNTSRSRYVERPASIDRPRPRANWRRNAFAARN